MRAEFAIGLCLLLMAHAPAVADDTETSTDAFDFFDYLGEMVEEDGEWLDPLAMETDLQLDGAAQGETDVNDTLAAEAPQGDDDE